MRQVVLPAKTRFFKMALKYHLYHEPPKPAFLAVFMVNNLVFRWPKPFFFMVLGAHGTYTQIIPQLKFIHFFVGLF